MKSPFSLNLLLWSSVLALTFSLVLSSSILRTKPQVWDVDDEELNSMLLPPSLEADFVGPLEIDYVVPSEEEDEVYDKEEKITNEESTDNTYNTEGIGLCVLPKNCANKDGTGLIEPRLKDHFRKCSKGRIFCPVEDLEDYPSCGISRASSSVSGNYRITGSNSSALFGEFPWVAMITERRLNGDDFFLCSGVLIDDRHLVTIAHCFDKSSTLDIWVRLGEHHLDEDNHNHREPLPHVEIEVETISLHPGYNSRNLHNDIAVLRLKTPLQTNKKTTHIAPICLPSPIEVRKFQVASSRGTASKPCTTTGWGLTSSPTKGKGKVASMSEVLKKVPLPLVESTRCEKMLRKTKLGRRFQLDGSFLCAGGEAGVDACLGDGGSALQCQMDDEAYSLVGLTSWGIGCGEQSVPGVYTNVLEFVDFIEQSKQLMADEEAEEVLGSLLGI